MKIWKTLGWVLRALVFLALLLFALKNSDPVTLHFFLDRTWQASLVLVLLAFFALGAALGVLACLTKLFSQRREIAALKREIERRQAADRPPPPPGAGA